MTPLKLNQVTFFGKGLERPECVLTTARGEVFTCDRRGGIAWVHDGADPTLFLAQDPSENFLPNGFALMPDRSFLVANLGDAGGVWQLTMEGKISPWLLEVDAQRLTTVNFIRMTPDGRQTVVLEDLDPETVKHVETRFARNRFGRQEIDMGSRRSLGNVSSLAFGGPDLRTVYLGSTHGDRLATFRSPIKGKEPVHWKF